MVRPQQRARLFVFAVALLAGVAVARGQSSYEKDLEIRTSRIPHAGNGVFTKVAIPKDAYLGAYAGEFITEQEFLRRSGAGQWQYMMGLRDCAQPRTGGLVTIDGVNGNVFTRMNYAPAEFQNVRFEKVCDAPFVKIVALRDIAAGEELWVDYGPRYHYDFMNDPAVIAFFAELRARQRLAPRASPVSWHGSASWPSAPRSVAAAGGRATSESPCPSPLSGRPAEPESRRSHRRRSTTCERATPSPGH